MADRPTDPAPGYALEFEFIHEGMRQDQRERHGFLGFTLAANGLILGLLMRSTPARTTKEACFLLALAAVVTIVAELLTIRASQGVATAGAYLRVFIEPHVDGLGYQRRNEDFDMKGRVSSSRGFGSAYLLVSVGAGFAWFEAPVTGGRTFWETAIIVGLSTTSVLLAGWLLWASVRGWGKVDDAWTKVDDSERAAAREPTRGA
jgi:hypothetical protein